MSKLMPQQLLCSVLEVTIAQALALNLNGYHGLKQLEQKTLTIVLADLGFPLSFTVNDHKILVSTLTQATDCRIETSFSTLMLLKKEQQLTELIKQNKLDISGDIKIAQQFSRIVETMNIDWQSELAKYIGDVATYKLSQVGKFIRRKVGFAASQIQADSTEWLVHEQRLVVTSGQIGRFNQQVSDVCKQTDSLHQQVERLEHLVYQHLAQKQGQS